MGKNVGFGQIWPKILELFSRSAEGRLRPKIMNMAWESRLPQLLHFFPIKFVSNGKIPTRDYLATTFALFPFQICPKLKITYKWLSCHNFALLTYEICLNCKIPTKDYLATIFALFLYQTCPKFKITYKGLFCHNFCTFSLSNLSHIEKQL